MGQIRGEIVKFGIIFVKKSCVDLSSRLHSYLHEIIGVIWAVCFSTGWNKFVFVDFVVHNYAMATLAQQLESVQTAIAEIELDGQTYHLDTQGKTRADLPALYERERRLLRKIAAEDGRGRTVAMF